MQGEDCQNHVFKLPGISYPSKGEIESVPLDLFESMRLKVRIDAECHVSNRSLVIWFASITVDVSSCRTMVARFVSIGKALVSYRSQWRNSYRSKVRGFQVAIDFLSDISCRYDPSPPTSNRNHIDSANTSQESMRVPEKSH